MYYIKYTLVLIALAVQSDGARKPWYNLNDARTLFTQYQYNYNRQYENEDDRERHFEAFVVNLLRINYLNSKKGSAVYDINMFTDHLVDDYKLLLNSIPSLRRSGISPAPSASPNDDQNKITH